MVIVLLPRSLRFCARGETESVPSRRRRQSSSTLNLEPNEGKGALSNRHSWFIRRRTRTNERQTPSARRSIPSLPRIALSHLAHRLSRHRVAPNPSFRSSFAPEGRRRPIHVSDDPPKRRSSAFHARRSAVPKSGDSDTYTEPNRTVRFASTRPTGVSHCRAVQPYPSTRTRTRSSQAPVRNRPRNRIHVTWTTSDSRRLMDSTTTRTSGISLRYCFFSRVTTHRFHPPPPSTAPHRVTESDASSEPMEKSAIRRNVRRVRHLGWNRIRNRIRDWNWIRPGARESVRCGKKV